MYRLERNKKLVGVNVRRYLLNCHESGHPVSMAEIYDFCPKQACGRPNAQAQRIIRIYLRNGYLGTSQDEVYQVMQPDGIKIDLIKMETLAGLRTRAGYLQPPPMPLPIFGEKQAIGKSIKFGLYVLKHMIYCHENKFSVRVRDLKKYSSYTNCRGSTPSNLSKLLYSLKKVGAIKPLGEGGLYEVANQKIIKCKIKEKETRAFIASVPKVGRPVKPVEECTPKESLKRDQERTRYRNNRKTLSKERQYPWVPSWLVMTESVIMNMNGTARHTPEIDGRWREFCR